MNIFMKNNQGKFAISSYSTNIIIQRFTTKEMKPATVVSHLAKYWFRLADAYKSESDVILRYRLGGIFFEMSTLCQGVKQIAVPFELQAEPAVTYINKYKVQK